MPARVTALFQIGVPVVAIAGVVAYAVSLGGFSLRQGDVAVQIRDLLWFVAACGIAAFATIEILKRVFQLRGLYQQRQVELWLNARSDGTGAFGELVEALGLRPRNAPPDAVASDERLLVFNLPTEQLAAQVSAAAEVALAEPKRYATLLAGLTGDAAEAVVPDVSAAIPTATAEGEKAELEKAELEKSELEYRLAQRVRAGVDQLQISLGERWRRYVQSAAVALAGLYGVALTEASDLRPEDGGRFVLAAVVIGGALAWVARDLAAVLERWRR